jgi:Carbohydrate family 9 binding domain-like
LKVFAFLLLLLSWAPLSADGGTPTFDSVKADHDVTLSLAADSPFWKQARPVFLSVDTHGKPLKGLVTEVRSRWTKGALYFLFICPYQQLYLKPNADTSKETYELWNWNVAEVFLGSNFQDIKRYREFEVSPHNEWIDLDVDLHKPHHEEGWVWNSGFEHKARIDEKKHVWYAALKIPFSALDALHAAAGMTFRTNLYRTEGPPDHTSDIVWQPTMSETFHVPEKFGLLKLVAK